MKKILIISAIVVVVVILVVLSVTAGSRNATTVQTGHVVRKTTLSSLVSASGEIKPKTYVNVGANAFGKITKLYVREGDRVKRGQILAQLENVQSAADVDAQRATVFANQTDAVAMEAALKTANAELARNKADLARAKTDYERAEGLYNQQLISKADYESRKATYEVAAAQVEQSQARIAQAKAQEDSAKGRVQQARATLTRASDLLSKTSYVAPFDGVITSLPVREGETVVVGIQNSPGSTLMTLADMSVITAEVKVDETDVVQIKNGQTAEINVDAMPGTTLKGIVTEIGQNAILRSSGISTSQTTTGSQEAKDFKVVITIENAPENLRPGLSATAKIRTAEKSNVLAIPIQALAIRTPKDLEDKKKASKNTAQAASPDDPKLNQEIQGVFKIEGKGKTAKVKFVPVKTGIAGSTEIEVTDGLSEKDEIVTGSYKALRSLKNGSSVKVDNEIAKTEEQT